jgi:hypothetical protein
MAANQCAKEAATQFGKTGRKEAIPRHNEIKKFLARSICRNLSVPIPPGN